MNYATWKLNFADPMYGTGPEAKMAELGIESQAAWLSGEIESGGIVLGYISEPVDQADFTSWEVINITEEEALEFCIEINSSAYLLEDGRITAPIED